MESKFKFRKRRVILKFGGEVLCGVGKDIVKPFNPRAIAFLVREFISMLQAFWDSGIEIILVIGGGNAGRGAQVKEALPDIPRADTHIMGMNNTENNGYVIEQGLAEDPWIVKMGIEIRLVNAFQGGQIGELYNLKRVRYHLKKRRIVIAVGGIGVPFFTTDTGAFIRALETEAPLILKCTKNAVCDKDPALYPDAKMEPRLTYQQCLERGLKIIDPQAIGTVLTLPPNERPGIAVFDVFREGALLRVLQGREEQVSYIAEPGWRFDYF